MSVINSLCRLVEWSVSVLTQSQLNLLQVVQVIWKFFLFWFFDKVELKQAKGIFF